MLLSERQNTAPVALPPEDSGLSRAAIVQVVVEVTPHRRRAGNGDLVLRGYVDNKEIEVVFPGRRQIDAAPLCRLLQRHVQMVKPDADGVSRLAVTGNARHKLRVDGIWRVQLLAELDGMPVRRFQLVAARWRYRAEDGLEHLYGQLPAG